MAAMDWVSFLSQQNSLAFVVVFMAALYAQSHFQSRPSSWQITAFAGAAVSGALILLVVNACALTHASSHDTFKWSFASYSAISLAFDGLLIGRLSGLYNPCMRLEGNTMTGTGPIRRAIAAMWRSLKSCPPSLIFHLVQGTVVMGFTFKGLEDLNEYLKPQLIVNHAQAAKRLHWFNSALIHLRTAAIVEAVLLTIFTMTVYGIVMRLSTKNGGLRANRKAWCALLIATMLMTMRATSNAIVVSCNSAISGQPLVDASSVTFWLFDLLPLLFSYVLMFCMVDDDDDEIDRSMGCDFVDPDTPLFSDEKILVISVPASA